MKTLLFSPMYLDDGRYERHTLWLDYLKTTPLKYDELFFVDNSSLHILRHPIRCTIHICEKHLPRVTHNAYGYWYRAFRIAVEHAIKNDFDRIVHVDTDAYLLSKKVVSFINDIDHGWTSLWCPTYKFPETAIQVISKDSFQVAKGFFTDGFLEYYPTDIAENKIPFTHVEKSFTGDRYGERNLPQTPDMDYYCQYNKGKLTYGN